jgi:putative N-acetylmannosamine-6-phosphate epimerase
MKRLCPADDGAMRVHSCQPEADEPLAQEFVVKNYEHAISA